MAKKNQGSNQKVAAEHGSVAETLSTATATSTAWNLPNWLTNFRIQAVVIVVIAFLSYANTFSNEYALDDLIVIVKNEYVYEGFAGMKDIFTKDAFDSYCREVNTTNNLSGGRYRPLSIATFAAEQQFLGPVPKGMADSVVSHALEQGPQYNKLLDNMHVRHVFNVLWFALSMVVLLYFLRYVVLKADPLVAFIAVLLFSLHPIHTEVVANVKSRDEIMSLLFICATFIFAHRFRESKKMPQLALALACYFLAFLSKEYAVTLLVLLPLSFYLFNKDTISDSLKGTLPYLAVAAIYFVIRLQIVGAVATDNNDTDIWNNPYALAKGWEKPATEIATTLNYLRLLLFPHPLSADYSYNTIAYKTFAHPLVWLSIIVHLALFTAMVYFLKKRNVLCFGIAIYLLNLMLVCNVIYDIGGTMGERLIYHSSVGFCIIVAWLLYKGALMIPQQQAAKILLTATVLLVGLLYGFKTVERNPQWKNDYTLFSHDVRNVPNSLLVNANLGAAVMGQSEAEKEDKKKNELLHNAITYLAKAETLDSVCIPVILNKAICYFRLRQADSARTEYERVIRLYPQYPPLGEMYYNVGVLYYFDKRYTDAINVWQQVLKLNPGYQQARQNIAIAEHDRSMQGK